MIRKNLIFVTGKKGAGKTSFLEIVSKKGYYTTELDKHYKKLLKDKDKEALSLPPESEWTDHVFKLVYQKELQNCDYNPIFFTGIYRMAELEYAFQNSIPIEIVQITADTSSRHKRILDRRREGEENITLDEIIIKDAKRDGTWPGYDRNNVNDLMSLANYTIKNSGSNEDLSRQIDEYIKYLKWKNFI